MAESGLKQVPTAWLAALAGRLGEPDVDLVRTTIATVRALPVAKTNVTVLTDAPGLVSAALPVTVQAIASANRIVAEASLERSCMGLVHSVRCLGYASGGRAAFVRRRRELIGRRVI